MPASTRILVVDSDATGEGEVQRILVSHRFVVLGGTHLSEDTVTMARVFQPKVVLLNLDDGQKSYRMAGLVAREFAEARLIAYSRRKDSELLEHGARVDFDGHPVKVVSAEERALLAAIESALAGPEENAPVAAVKEHDEPPPPPPTTSPAPVTSSSGLAAPPWEGGEPFLLHFAQLASEWLLTRSPQAEERLMTTLAEDAQAPSFAGSGRDAIRRGLEGLAWRLGGEFRLVPSDLGSGPVLSVMVETRDGHWHRAGYFVVGVGDGNTISYFDYRDDEPSGKPDPEAP